MVHESVFDVIHGDEDDESEYEDGGEEEEEGEEAGQLRSGFKALDITRKSSQEDGEMAGAEDGGAARTRVEWCEGRKEEEEEEKGKVHRRKKIRKKSRKGDGRKEHRQPVSIERFVVQTCRRIEETKYPLFREAVDRIGVDAMKALLTQVDVIESCGGQMTADGLRRRSAGGVLWNLLRGHVGAGLYKEIMKEGNRKHLEQQKARSKARESERLGNTNKRSHTDMEIEHDAKRRRTSVDAPTIRSRRGASRERRGLREETDNVRTPAALQIAWVQGLKKPSLGFNAPAPSHAVAIKRPVSQRVRMAVSYGDLVEEGEIATDSPIHGVTEVEVGDEAAADNVREEGEVLEEGEVAD